MYIVPVVLDAGTNFFNSAVLASSNSNAVLPKCLISFFELFFFSFFGYLPERELDDNIESSWTIMEGKVIKQDFSRIRVSSKPSKMYDSFIACFYFI